MADLVALSLSFFSIGILSGASPCALPLVPGFIGYLSTQGSKLGEHARWLVGIVVTLGVASSIVVFAVAATLFHIAISALIVTATPIVVAVLALFGFLLIANENPFDKLPYVKLPKLGGPLLSAYAYGSLYGVIAFPCSSLYILPFTILVSLSKISSFEVFIFFLSFGLGLGLPLVVVSFLSRVQGDWLVRQFAKRTRIMNVIVGLVLVGIALYDLVIVYFYPQFSI